jgi:SAM-dependent methyltransferase
MTCSSTTSRPASFDLVHARAVLEHIPAREEALDRIAHWLKPDGALVLVDCASYPIPSSQHQCFRVAMQAWVDVIVDFPRFRGHLSAWPVWVGQEDGVHVQAKGVPPAVPGFVSS